jgi:hypothetical protein
MRGANLSLQEMVLNFWISLDLSLNVRHFPRIKVFKLLNSEYEVKPRYSATVHRNVWWHADCDGKSKECVNVISVDTISWELSVGGAISMFMSVSYADQQSQASSNCDNSGLMLRNI